MTVEPTLNGMIIGQAEAATRAVLDGFLASNGTSFLPWVLLTLITRAGGRIQKNELLLQVRRSRKLAEPPIVAALGQVCADGYVRVDAGDPRMIEMTSAGSVLYERLRAGVDSITTRLYANLSADDLKTTSRVLMVLTERANAELAEQTR
jgi:hypothetical protein